MKLAHLTFFTLPFAANGIPGSSTSLTQELQAHRWARKVSSAISFEKLCNVNGINAYVMISPAGTLQRISCVSNREEVSKAKSVKVKHNGRRESMAFTAASCRGGNKDGFVNRLPAVMLAKPLWQGADPKCLIIVKTDTYLTNQVVTFEAV